MTTRAVAALTNLRQEGISAVAPGPPHSPRQHPTDPPPARTARAPPPATAAAWLLPFGARKRRLNDQSWAGPYTLRVAGESALELRSEARAGGSDRSIEDTNRNRRCDRDRSQYDSSGEVKSIPNMTPDSLRGQPRPRCLRISR